MARQILILISVLMLFLGGLEAKAEILIQPDFGNSDRIVVEGNPGEKKISNLRLYNSDEQTQLQVSSNDLVVTSDGLFTLAANNVQNMQTGSWIKPAVSNIILPKKSNTILPLQITIPDKIIDGEYAGGVSFLSTDNTGQNTVKVVSRKAVRTYILVGEKFDLQTQVSDLNIVSPNSPTFEDDKQNMPFLGKENIIFKWQMENQGNVFASTSLEYEINLPDGTKVSGKNNYELAPRVGKRNYYLVTKAPYLVGKTSLQLNWKTIPLNQDAGKVNSGMDSGNISTDVNLSSNDISQLGNQKFKPVQTTSEYAGELENKVRVETDSEVEVSNTPLWLYLVSSGLFGLAIVVFAKLLVFEFKPGLLKKLLPKK